MILEQTLLEKLTRLRHNNNKLIEDMNKLNRETLETETQLKTLKKDLEELSDCYLTISKPLLEISSQINYLKTEAKNQKKLKQQSKQSKSQKKLKMKKIEEMTEKEKSLKYSSLIIFLFNEFMKSKDREEIIDNFIDDTDSQDDQEE